ncbi:Annexin [Psidium guajava]|nr:Annexin [Psidium guajava]
MATRVPATRTTKARMVTGGEQLEDATTPTTPKPSLRSRFRQ